MNKSTLAIKLSSRAVAALLTLALVAVGTVEWKALLAKERRENPPRLLDLAYCTKCHSDAKMLKKMRIKEGSSHFLFNDSPGKPASCPAQQQTGKGSQVGASQWMQQTRGTAR